VSCKSCKTWESTPFAPATTRPRPSCSNLCDRMGIVVWDEAFDKWDGTATMPKGVSIAEHGRKQYTNFVRRDRNHPCVVVWSVGNEIWDLEGLKYPDAPGLLKTMVGFVKALDTTAPGRLGAVCAGIGQVAALGGAGCGGLELRAPVRAFAGKVAEAPHCL